MSIQSHLDSAEESLRQALIESLNEKVDSNLPKLFELLNAVKDLHQTRFDFSDLDLSSDYLTTLGNINGNISINTGGADVIKFPTGESLSDIDLDPS